MKKAFVTELYFRELDTKRDLDARPTLHVAVLSVLGSLLAYAFVNFRSADRVQVWWFFTAVTSAVILYVLALYHVIRSNLGHFYERLPSVKIVDAYRASLDDYFKQNPGAPGTAGADFDSFIRRHMVNATSRNEYANLSRAARHYSAMRAISLCAVFILIASVPLLWNSRSRQAGVEGIPQQDSFFGGAMTDTEKPKPATQPATPSKPEPTFPPKPVEPDNTLFRGTKQPEKPKVPAPRIPPTPKPQR